MKKQFFRYTAGFIPFIALFSCASAQSNKSSPELNNPTSKEVAYTNTANGRDVPGTININAKALKNFSKTYKKASAAGWFVIKDGYLAQFKQDGITTKVFYDAKGRWVGNLRCYFEDKLPRDIRHRVKSHYYDYNIYYVQELTVGNATVYLVKIEDKTSFKTIRVQDGEMTEAEAFTKSK
jgi:hypothetical protein